MENSILSVADQSGTLLNQPHVTQKDDRVSSCVYPDRYGCRGCEYSYRPDLSDGGCRLYFESVDTGRIHEDH